MKAALGLLIAAQLLTVPTAVLGTANNELFTTGSEISSGKEDQTREEQFMWFFRNYNGKEQKRLICAK